MTYHELCERYGESLTERNLGGIHTALFYDRASEEIFIFYLDVKTNLSFTLDPPKHLALDAFNHPIMYFKGELNGTSNPQSLNPAMVS
jgi:hypothetical protein